MGQFFRGLAHLVAVDRSPRSHLCALCAQMAPKARPAASRRRSQAKKLRSSVFLPRALAHSCAEAGAVQRGWVNGDLAACPRDPHHMGRKASPASALDAIGHSRAHALKSRCRSCGRRPPLAQLFPVPAAERGSRTGCALTHSLRDRCTQSNRSVREAHSEP